MGQSVVGDELRYFITCRIMIRNAIVVVLFISLGSCSKKTYDFSPTWTIANMPNKPYVSSLIVEFQSFIDKDLGSAKEVLIYKLPSHPIPWPDSVSLGKVVLGKRNSYRLTTNAYETDVFGRKANVYYNSEPLAKNFYVPNRLIVSSEDSVTPRHLREGLAYYWTPDPKSRWLEFEVQGIVKLNDTGRRVQKTKVIRIRDNGHFRIPEGFLDEFVKGHMFVIFRRANQTTRTNNLGHRVHILTLSTCQTNTLY